MAHAEPPSRSRIGWPHREVPEPPTLPVVVADKRKTHRRQWAAIVALYLVVALNTYLVLLDHQYVVGRGQYRDAEDARMEQESIERLRQFACDLLDGLPAGPLLDPKRETYECGPGIPVDQLPPDVRANLGELRGAQSGPGGEMARPAPGQSPEPVSEDPPPGTPPVDAPPRQGTTAPTEPATPTARAVTPPATPSTPGPALDLSPLTDTVCDLIGVCL